MDADRAVLLVWGTMPLYGGHLSQAAAREIPLVFAVGDHGPRGHNTPQVLMRVPRGMSLGDRKSVV